MLPDAVRKTNSIWDFVSAKTSEMMPWYNRLINEGFYISLVAGSQAEGFAMAPNMGYERPDLDIMIVYGGGWSVRMQNCADYRYMSWHKPYGITDADFPHLQMCDAGCPAGYYKVKVIGSPDELIGRLGKAGTSDETCSRLGFDRASNCLSNQGETVWLSSSKTVENFSELLAVEKDNIFGPAQRTDNGSAELIVTLLCIDPHAAMTNYHFRSRQSGWPSKETMARMKISPGMLVCASNKLSRNDQQSLQFRLSFSLQELLLAMDMPRWTKQGYTAFKYTIKSMLTRHRQSVPSEGRSYVCSYHLKTVLLWTLGDREAWTVQCPFQLMMILLASLKSCISKSTPVIPNYFIPESNLLDHTDRKDIDLLLKVIKQIQEEPVMCILDASTSPGELYGKGVVVGKYWKEWASRLRNFNRDDIGASKEQLQECFHKLEGTNRHRRPFRWLLAAVLLSRLESYRKWLYQNVRLNDMTHEDTRQRVYWRPEPRRLMGIWHEVIHSWSRDIQYIPRNMHTVLLCFALLRLCNRS